MIIAVTTEFGDNFDRFIYYEIFQGQVKQREEVRTVSGSCQLLAKQLVSLQIDLLITGNISADLLEALNTEGIQVLNAFSGKNDAVLKEYLDGRLLS